MYSGPTLRPLAEPLNLAAIELADLARLSDRLQTSIARLTADRGTPDSGFLTEVQAVDLLSQRLEGMAAFLRVLAASAPTNVTTDVHAAVMGLTLAEQARRLSGAQPAPAALVDDGELQLFADLD
ncbi:hypothetical protein [Phenylobacterium sp.]|uniref:hypothetical protein n=1 Tax=Phenylobacterium sp. TaxID=1871053 RepID=UPI00121B2BA7|nr:hypothetical protein [Phenylobacterium sp.]THD59932.1 MAG: hypothetical protein E8A12_11265 [Phenylobacterium sp.]